MITMKMAEEIEQHERLVIRNRTGSRRDVTNYDVRIQHHNLNVRMRTLRAHIRNCN